MGYNELIRAYSDWTRGAKTSADLLALYQEMPDVHEKFYDGATLLHLAAGKNDKEAVLYLLSRGADPNAEDDSGATPLMYVATNYNLTPQTPPGAVYEIVTALLEAGASAMKKDADGNWCYSIAAKWGNGEFIKALYDKGIRITRADDSANNGLHLLIESLYNPISDFQQAQKRAERSKGSRNESSDLELMERCRQTMEYRIEAACIGIKALLAAGVDPEDKNNIGETAHVLAERRGAKKVSALLKGELTEDAEDNELKLKAGGLTLHQAVAKADEEAIRALVQLGADVNEISDIYGCGEGTPLAMACRECDYRSAQLLLELGADPNLKAGNDTSAISWISVSDKNVQQAISENWPDKLITALVAGGLNLNDGINEHGDTLLTYALSENHRLEVFLTRETLRWLIVNSAIKQGADVNLSNNYGQTPLMIIGVGNNWKIKMAADLQFLLLDKGARVDAKDMNGNTPLIYVATNTDDKTAVEMAENLFDFGNPQLEAVNNAGKSALDYATENNHEMLVKFLINKL